MSDLTRITVNLTGRALAALGEIAAADGCGKTVAISRSLVAYAYLSRAAVDGATVKLHRPGGSVEAVTFL